MVDDCLDAECPVNQPLAVYDLTAKGADTVDVGKRAGRILRHQRACVIERRAGGIPDGEYLFHSQTEVGKPAVNISRVSDDSCAERWHIPLVFKNHSLIRGENS